MVYSLLSSLPSLANVFAFLLFIMMLFAVCFTHFYTGRLRYRCVLEASGGHLPISDDELQSGPMCTISANSGRFCRDPLGNKNDSYKCLNDYTVAESGVSYPHGANPNYGVTGFDNIMLSLLNVLIALSGEGWTDIMYKVSVELCVCVCFGFPRKFPAKFHE